MKRPLLYFLFAFLFVMLAGLTYHLFVYARTTVAASLIINILKPLSVLLFMVMCFVVGRSLFYVVWERRQGRPGSRIKVRLVGAFLFIALVPSLIIFFLSTRFLDDVLINFGLDPNVQNTIVAADTLSKEYLSDLERMYLARAPELWELNQQAESADAIRRYLHKNGMQGVEFYQGKLLKHRVLAAEIEPEFLARVLETEGRFAERNPGDDGLLVVRFLATQQDQTLAMIYCKATAFTQKFNFIADSYSYLQHSLRKSERVRFINRGLLLVTTFSVIFGGVWLGLNLSRRLMTGITALIQGAESIAQGDYDTAIHLGSGDEMENVAEAFNTMRCRLKQSQVELESRNLDLADANARLSGQIQYTETLLNRINTGILSLDPEDRILTANPAALRILDLEQVEMRTPFKQLVTNEKHQSLLRVWEGFRKQGYKPVQVQQEWRGSEGEPSMFVAVSMAPLLDEEEHLGGLVVLEDLTQLQNAQKLAAWREVARRIAHEIKNPLTPIQLSIQRVARKSRNRASDLEQVIESAYETIMAETGMLKNLLEEFTTFAKLPAPIKAPLKLDELVRSVVESYGPAYSKLQIRMDLASVPMVSLDSNQMRQVLINLLGNASAAMSEGGEVLIELEVVDRELELRIRDQGIGIADEDKDKIFLPYFSKSSKGTGLGLAIVKRIVEDHGGRILVENNGTQGACFRLIFALEPQQSHQET